MTSCWFDHVGPEYSVITSRETKSKSSMSQIKYKQWFSYFPWFVNLHWTFHSSSQIHKQKCLQTSSVWGRQCRLTPPATSWMCSSFQIVLVPDYLLTHSCPGLATALQAIHGAPLESHIGFVLVSPPKERMTDRHPASKRQVLPHYSGRIKVVFSFPGAAMAHGVQKKHCYSCLFSKHFIWEERWSQETKGHSPALGLQPAEVCSRW